MTLSSDKPQGVGPAIVNSGGDAGEDGRAAVQQSVAEGVTSDQMTASLGYRVCVFSYNRGRHLQTCLESVFSNSRAESVVVYDDGSDDRETRRVLATWEGRARIVRRCRDDATGGNRGRLHRNMEHALEEARSHGVPYALMLQDDMQIVRPVFHEDISTWNAFFEGNTNSVTLYVAFDVHHEASPEEWYLDASGTALLPQYPITSDSYSATGLFDVRRFHEAIGQLEVTEHRTTLKLASRGFVKGRACAPFTMFTPYPMTTRRGWSVRGVKTYVAERLSGAGVHPYRTMAAEKVNELRRRHCASPPLARAWLDCPSMQHRAVWSYYGGPRDLRAVGGFRSALGWLLGGRAPSMRRGSADKASIH